MRAQTYFEHNHNRGNTHCAQIAMPGVDALCVVCLGVGSWPSGRCRSCSACLGPWYCSKQCQLQDWKEGHKQSCQREVLRVLRRDLELPDNVIQEILRFCVGPPGGDLSQNMYTPTHLFRHLFLDICARMGAAKTNTFDVQGVWSFVYREYSLILAAKNTPPPSRMLLYL